MTLHHLESSRENLNGAFSREHEPILTIQAGDMVRYQTLDATWSLEPPLEDGRPRRKMERRVPGEDGHCLVGPIFIAGAEPGATLEIQIGTIRPGAYGFVLGGGWQHPVNERFALAASDGVVHRWVLDSEMMTGHNQYGHTVTLRPFMGVMGMAPDLPGSHPTPPPRFCGGNIDCKELVAGTSLFLPIAVRGGLFYVGDGHAAQGDGEVSVTAIECPMDQVDLTFLVHPELHLTQPRAKTSGGWITFGFHEDLQEAAYLALEDMLALMGEQYHVGRADALALASVVVDLHVTQIVNGVRGVHAILPTDAIR
jgi:acetamidase/formamidase